MGYLADQGNKTGSQESTSAIPPTTWHMYFVITLLDAKPEPKDITWVLAGQTQQKPNDVTVF